MCLRQLQAVDAIQLGPVRTGPQPAASSTVTAPSEPEPANVKAVSLHTLTCTACDMLAIESGPISVSRQSTSCSVQPNGLCSKTMLFALNSLLHTVPHAAACSMRPDIPDMNEVKLNSYYYEVGERSFMKEQLAYQVCGNSNAANG